MKAKADARRARLRAKIEQRTQGVQIEAPETKDREPNNYVRLGSVLIKQSTGSNKTRRGVDVKRRKQREVKGA